jgi:hypothetical protein
MIWDRLIRNSETIIQKLNFYLDEYNEPGLIEHGQIKA